jgi:phosphoribosylformylglycinamidine (FGAM) synthase-like amidotransferase family enzyme
MSTKPRALVLTGDGINCESETATAFRLAGFDAEVKHLNDLIAEQLKLDELQRRYQALALPGGFSFGDDLTSGKVLALKITHRLGWNLNTYAERGGLVIGICNGFQALIRMGVFGKDISITHNSHGKFMNSWIKATPNGSRCVWLKGLGSMDLPIRHGEGRLVISTSRRNEVLEKMDRHGMTCFKYETDPNGSDERLAGLCDTTGRIFGLMPHPEAFVRWTSHPEWTAQPGRASAPGQGLALFENAYQEALRATS